MALGFLFLSNFCSFVCFRSLFPVLVYSKFFVFAFDIL
jgi:hypothetical protein